MRGGAILYVEDDENDVFLIRRAFARAGIAHPLKVVADGDQAMAYLAGRPPFARRQEHPLPALLLLDLNLPRAHGLELLRWVREQPAWHTLPVLVLSSSNQPRDIHRAYALGANAFLVKPSAPQQLLELAQALGNFWLVHNQPPPDPLPFRESARTPAVSPARS